jgi:hypothetical protein
VLAMPLQGKLISPQEAAGVACAVLGMIIAMKRMQKSSSDVLES